jgi:predicted CXXCH cytochrome family protein
MFRRGDAVRGYRVSLTQSRRLLLAVTALTCLVLSLLALPEPVPAKVEGSCSNCHTVTRKVEGGETEKSGVTPIGVFEVSTVGDCLSCHSSPGPETVRWIGECQVPIVYNMEPPSRPLAAGNFYWVSRGPDFDSCGHNVRGVTLKDSRLRSAPGADWDPGPGGCACHGSLAGDDPRDFKGLKNGCRGCHISVRHHAPDALTGTVTHRDNGFYRFLTGHSSGMGASETGCEGVEDAMWEQTGGHNGYKGSLSENDPTGIDWVCRGCHPGFHAAAGAPWARHPTGILLPSSGEYGRYDCVGNYNLEVPVGFLQPAAPSRDTAVVICLSCHRAHGSPYPSMLRWDYQNLSDGQGCLTCHTEKY